MNFANWPQVLHKALLKAMYHLKTTHQLIANVTGDSNVPTSASVFVGIDSSDQRIFYKNWDPWSDAIQACLVQGYAVGKTCCEQIRWFWRLRLGWKETCGWPIQCQLLSPHVVCGLSPNNIVYILYTKTSERPAPLASPGLPQCRIDVQVPDHRGSISLGHLLLGSTWLPLNYPPLPTVAWLG